MPFLVQDRLCATCIYRPDSPLDLNKLENDVRDEYKGFAGHRICHHSDTACCRGFWNKHKNDFPMGQIAQRLNAVEFVHHDTMGDTLSAEEAADLEEEKNRDMMEDYDDESEEE